MRRKLTLLEGTRGVDLLVEADPGATVAQLARALAAHVDAPSSRTAEAITLRRRGHDDAAWRLLPAGDRLDAAALASGDVVAIVPAPARDPTAPPVAALEVLGGPAAGERHELRAGNWVLGRDPRCDVVLADPMVSARHARLRLGDAPELVDLGAANGIVVDGEQVGRVSLADDATFLLGGTLLRLRRLAPAIPRRDGEVRVIRSPRVEPRHPERRFAAPPPPATPEPERFPWLVALAPLALGIGAALVLERPATLLFALATPLMLLGGFLAQRSRRRRRARLAAAEYEERLDELAAGLAAAHAEELAVRLAESPSTREVLQAVAERGPLLWTRRPEHTGFLALRLGTADLAARTVVEAASAELPREARARLDELVARHRRLLGAPVSVGLEDDGAIGIAGAAEAVAPVLDGVLAQVVGLHAPSEVVVAALVSADWAQRLTWLPWVPHASPAASPLGPTPHLAGTAASAGALLDALERLVVSRGTAPRPRGRLPDGALDHPEALGRIRDAGASARRLPAVVLVISRDAPVPIARRIALGELGPEAGIHPIWVADGNAELPAACRTTIEATGGGTGIVRRVRLGETIHPVTLETPTPHEIARFARALSPLVDAADRPVGTAALPARVPLAALLGTAILDEPDAVLERWREHDATARASPTGARPLQSIIGVGPAGPVRLDLRAHGPHALVAGTTGAGKSELLRAWVAGLAAEHSPERVAFLLVDYKGGSAFADCVRLPHCVGLVTDLRPRLVRRVLVSLGAELRHRERLFARLGAKELVELEARGSPEAPPALVIVVDEFAALAREVPEFVDGVVDLAQRGRALGIHLVLATQRPAGVVKDSIRANANLRIALRMAETADSLDIVGAPSAAQLDPDLPGRALVRVGPRRLDLVQTAYPGAMSAAEAAGPRIRVAPLGEGLSVHTARPAAPVPTPRATTATDLERLVATVGAAAARAGIPAPRRPWLDELPARLELETLLTGDDACIPIGLSDAPGAQAHRLAAFRPDADGHLVVLGASGSGKSAALRTIAVATACTPQGGPVAVYGIDCASGGLRAIEALAHVGSVVPGDDVERVRRLLDRLTEELRDRARRWSEVDAATLPEHRARVGAADTARVLLLLDGFAAFREEWEGRPGRAATYDRFREVLAAGRALGIHVVLSADRAAALPSSVAAAVQRRLELRAGGEARLGVDDPAPPGRGVLDGLETQVAVLGAAPRADSPSGGRDALEAYARRHEAAIPRAAPIRAMPARLDAAEAPRGVGGRPTLGVSGQDLEFIGFDPSGILLVAGRPGSGRTNALNWIATSLRTADSSCRIIRLGPRGASIAGADVGTRSVAGIAEVAAAARALAESPPPAHCALVLESVAGFVGTPAEAPVLELVRGCRDTGVLVVAEEQLAGWSEASVLLAELRAARRGLVLQPESGDTEFLLRVALPREVEAPSPPGRAWFAEQGRGVLVQLPHIRPAD